MYILGYVQHGKGTSIFPLARLSKVGRDNRYGITAGNSHIVKGDRLDSF